MTSPSPVPIFDGHNDALLRLYLRGGADGPRAFLDGEEKGHVDLPKAQAGGMAGGLFAIFVPPQPRSKRPVTSAPPDAAAKDDGVPLSPPDSVALEPAQQAVHAMASLLFRIERESQGRVRICRTVADIRHCIETGTLATVLHIEGAEAIDANLEALDVLHAAGLRSIGPVWSRPNIFGHGVPFRFPSSPDIGPGLTDAGRELISACNRLRIMIDLSHLNEKGFWDVASLSDAPLVATHSNAHAVCAHSRNLTDQQLAAIRESGGMVGVNFAVNFLRPDGQRNRDTPVEIVLDHVDHLLAHVGENGVGFGSDFDGATMPTSIGNAGGLQRLVAAMRARGYGEPLIAKLCHENWLRVLERTWNR